MTENNKIIEISYHVCETKINKHENNYLIIHKYMPIKQCNAITIHKSQGMTLKHCILNCDGIFANSMFYIAISRIEDPNNMQILKFKESY